MSIEATLREIVGDITRQVVREELRAALGEARPAQPVTPEFLTTMEASALAGVRPPALRSWIGKGLRVHHAGRELRIAREDLLAFMRRSANSDGFDADARARDILAKTRSQS